MSRPHPERTPSEGDKTGNAPGKDSLASILTFEERSDLVNLIDSITSSILHDIAATFHTPQSASAPAGDQAVANNEDLDTGTLRRATLRWYTKWKDLVIKRICEAANTRWEPLAQKKKDSVEKSWDELSWDDEPQVSKVSQSAPADTQLQAIYPPVPTPLKDGDHDKRLLLLHSMLLLLLSLKHYHAASRLLMLRLASSLNLTTDDVDKDEERTATSLVSGAKEMSAKEEVQRKAQENQSSRTWKVLGASVAGAALIGLTGGLAAPLVAAGIGTVMGGLGLGATAAAGLLGSLAGSSVLVGGLFGAYGARMTGQMMEQYAREVSDFAFIPLRSKSKGEEDVKEVDPADRRLRVTIGVSGWLTDKSDVLQPWAVFSNSTEVFALRWELEALSRLGSGMRELLTSAAWNYAKTEVLKLTVFSTLIGAVALPLGLLQLGKLVDNPFQVAKNRADKAGEVLADAIINRAQGERPVALVGYSLGARLVYACLQNLAKRQAFGLVDSVVFYGAPVPSSEAEWRKIRAVAGGRVINIYSENDYVLGFLYRALSAQAGIAGLQKINVRGVENKDVSDVVTSHFQYRHLIGRVLKEVGWKDLDQRALDHESAQLEQLLEQERKIAEILQDKDTHSEEKQELKKLMETKAPVQHESESAAGSSSPPPVEESAPQLPPRPRPGPTQNAPSTMTERSKDVASADHSENSPVKPMQHMEDPEPEKDEDEDEDGLEHQFSGISMVDND